VGAEITVLVRTEDLRGNENRADPLFLSERFQKTDRKAEKKSFSAKKLDFFYEIMYNKML
jgi:hypothetical protein